MIPTHFRMAAILWVFNNPSHDNAAEARLFLKTRIDLTVHHLHWALESKDQKVGQMLWVCMQAVKAETLSKLVYI